MKALTCLLLTVLFYVSTSTYAQTLLPAAPLVRKDVTVPAFSALAIQGPLNVVLVTQKSPSPTPVQIFGDAKTVSEVTWKVNNHTLFLATKWSYHPQCSDKLSIRVNITPAQLTQVDFASNGRLFGKDLSGSLALTTSGSGDIELFTHQLDLKSLVTNGNTTLSIYDLNSTGLSILGKNTGKIKLQGQVVLNTIHLKGDGTLQIYWVNSPNLKINISGKEKVFLAGVAHILEAHLTNHSQLSAKQLRTDIGMIATSRHALADITVKQRLTALAQDKSIIYYAKPVLFSSIFTENTGLILSH